MENQNIEYKKTWRDEYLKWICAFASDKYLALMNEHIELENVPLSPKMSDKMSDKDKSRLSVVLGYLQKSKNISSSKAAELLNVEIKTANRLLVKAVELGILDATGINKTRTYSIKMCGEEK